MSADEANENRAAGKMNSGNYPVIIPSDVEYIAAVMHIVSRIEITDYIGVSAPIALAYECVPCA